jgi:DNA-directed RNA polymerase subunit beta'
MFDTTTGRVLIWEIVPKGLEFDIINRVLRKKELASLIDAAYRQCTSKETVILADQLKDMGYREATKAGISIAVGDLTIPDVKEKLLGEASLEVKEIEQQYFDGLITNGERYNKVVDIWDRVSNAVAEGMMDAISK